MLPESHEWNVVIADTSCFILLDKIEVLSILQKLFVHVITTPEIVIEFGGSLPSWVEIKPVSNKTLQFEFESIVDAGEASAIALSRELSSALLIIDDLRGRKLAQRLQIAHTGTIGILLLAKQKGVINLLKPYFDKIQITNFRISSVLLNSILQLAGE